MTDRKQRPTLPDGFAVCTVCGELYTIVSLHIDGLARFCNTCVTLPRGEMALRAKETMLRQWKTRAVRPGPQRPATADLQALRTALLCRYSMAGGKPCSTCGHLKPVTAFYPDKTRKDGLYLVCKSCQRIRRQLKAKGQIDLWPAVREALRLAPA